MATVTANRLAENFRAALRSAALFRSDGRSGRAHGWYKVKVTRTLTAAEIANFDGAGDFLELAVLPQYTYLGPVSVTVPDMDSGALLTLDLMLDATVLVNDSTAGQAGGTISHTPTGQLDSGGKTLKLKIEAAGAGAGPYGVFTAIFDLYVGAPTTV